MEIKIWWWNSELNFRWLPWIINNVSVDGIVKSLDDLKNIEGAITVSNNETDDTLGEYDIKIK